MFNMVGRKILEYFVNGLFWSSTLLVLVPVFGLLLHSVYDNFLTSSIAFTLDTLYLHWNTTFPAVSVCEIYNGEKNWEVSENYFGIDRDHRIDDFVSEITFFRGTCEACYRCNNMTCPTNFNELISKYRTTCSKLLSNCSWTDRPFECCDQFRPLITEYGICYSFNSAQAGSMEVRYENNRESGPGKLSFLSHEDVQIHLHPPNDVPYLYSEGVIRETILWGSNKEIIFNVMDIFNDQSVKNYDPLTRKCRFQKENYEKTFYKLYSFSTCIVECVQHLHLSQCKCNFLINKENTTFCDIEGIKCLSENYAHFNSLRKDCECMSSCEEPEYNVVFSSSEESNQESEASKISISMIDLPTQRYVRKVVKNFLDFTISIGGIAGLFFGASVLSLIEIIYMLSTSFKNVYILKKICRKIMNFLITKWKFKK